MILKVKIRHAVKRHYRPGAVRCVKKTPLHVISENTALRSANHLSPFLLCCIPIKYDRLSVQHPFLSVSMLVSPFHSSIRSSQ
jgi:hypothetical protein